jgi:hypothetical protein
MRIYAVGCSTTIGEELADPVNTCYPALIAQRFGAELTNDAHFGGSNSRTTYRTIKHTQDAYDLYLIAWSADSRFTFYNADTNEEVNFTPKLISNPHDQHDNYKIWGRTLYQSWYNRLYGFKQWLQQIIQVQTILEQQGKQYLMLNTVHNNLDRWLSPRESFLDAVRKLINVSAMNDSQIVAEHEEIQYYLSLINTDKFYGWNEFAIRDLDGHFAMGTKTHMLEAGHEHLANLIYNHLCSK